MAKIPHVDSTVDRMFRNIVNTVIDVINSKGEHLFEIESFDQWLSENSFTPKPSVIKLDDLPTDALKNEVRGVEETNKIYVYDGTEWIDFASLSFDELTLLNDSLHDKINEVNAIKSALDTKVDEVNTLIEDSNYWQKHKMTQDNGELEVYVGFDFNTEVEAISGTKTFYVATSVNQPYGVSYNGYVDVQRRTDEHIMVTYTPYNSERIFVRLKTKSGWQEWKEITSSKTDTGWIEFDFTIGNTNTAYGGSQNGFKTAHRTVVDGDTVTRYVRLNGSGVKSGDLIAKLPSGFVEHSQVFFIRTPLRYVANVTFNPSGDVRFYINDTQGKSEWTVSSANYVYGEFSWSEYSKKNG